MLARIKELIKTYHSEIIFGIIVVSITAISFNLGRISAQNTTARLPLTISSPINQGGGTTFPAVEPLGSKFSGSTAQPPKNPTVVASKAAGSKLYHFTWCSGAKRIAEKNKITFPNEEAAIAAGYTLASNCQP